MKIERKSKFYIFLIEILWGILFFALSSIICVNFFVKSNEYSKEAVSKNEAMLIGESVAELMRDYSGELEGFDLVAPNHYQKEINGYLVDITSDALELGYMKHCIEISNKDHVLVEFDVMSGGYENEK